MELTELRIGNYINGLYETEVDKGNGIIEDVEVEETVRVVCIDTVEISEYQIWVEDGTRENYWSFEPIPLTEEWLVKFGFKEVDKDKYDDYRVIYQLTEKNITKPKYVDISVAFIEDEINIFLSFGECIEHITAIHQLQNLYFALTNKELTLKQ